MIYLGGGGSADDEAAVFAAAFQPPARITIWPWAQPPQHWPSTLSWLQTSVSRLGVFPPVQLAQEPHFGLHNADIIVIPGGNTFALLAYMQQHDLLARLRTYVSNGGKVYGGSAGALVQGADIAIIDALHGGMDANEVGVRDTRGADLLRGCVVLPHYGDEWETHCERWSLRMGVCVLGIPERAGLEVDAARGTAVNLGPEDVVVFKGGKGERVSVGESMVLGLE